MTEIECQEIFANLSEYLDHELPPDLCDRVAAHIDGCPPCVEFVASLRKSVDLCRRLGDDAPGAPFPADVKERLLDTYRRAMAE